MQMSCEECSHFLEIAEAIRSLGLTILKGITEVHSEKTWICFVVEVCLNLVYELSFTRGTSCNDFFQVHLNYISKRWVLKFIDL